MPRTVKECIALALKRTSDVDMISKHDVFNEVIKLRNNPSSECSGSQLAKLKKFIYKTLCEMVNSGEIKGFSPRGRSWNVVTKSYSGIGGWHAFYRP
jgi:hypothetical protein